VSLMVCVELLCCCIDCLERRRKNRAEGFVKQVVKTRAITSRYSCQPQKVINQNPHYQLS
jgi:hypothetical protein